MLVKIRNVQIMANEKVVVIPIVIRTLGTITKKFEKYIKSLGIEIKIEHVQKSPLLVTAKIITKVLSCYVPKKGYCCETFDIWLMSALTTKTRHTKTSTLGGITLNTIAIVVVVVVVGVGVGVGVVNTAVVLTIIN